LFYIINKIQRKNSYFKNYFTEALKLGKQVIKPYNLIYFPEIISTNTHALKNISGFSDRDVLMAEIQTSGRGRFDRKWISDKPGNIYISFVLKPNLQSEQLYLLTDFSIYLAVKLCEILETYGVNPTIKQPNDVLVDNKKIAGILAQSSIRGNILQGLVLGIGINLNLEKTDLEKIDQPATSLNLLLNSQVDRDSFLEKLLNNFFGNYDEFLQATCSAIAPKAKL
jgi:BirA family transcriptional regulator, biotin operon repressor / biotin---[acetyl-CoA-carboxylase] ligase